LRRTHYHDVELRAWVERITRQPVTRAHVHFMREDATLGTRFARRLAELYSA
jgi:hypothetical protein